MKCHFEITSKKQRKNSHGARSRLVATRFEDKILGSETDCDHKAQRRRRQWPHPRHILAVYHWTLNAFDLWPLSNGGERECKQIHLAASGNSSDGHTGRQWRRDTDERCTFQCVCSLSLLLCRVRKQRLWQSVIISLRMKASQRDARWRRDTSEAEAHQGLASLHHFQTLWQRWRK